MGGGWGWKILRIFLGILREISKILRSAGTPWAADFGGFGGLVVVFFRVVFEIVIELFFVGGWVVVVFVELLFFFVIEEEVEVGEGIGVSGHCGEGVVDLAVEFIFGEGSGFVFELPEPFAGPVLFAGLDACDFLGAFECGVGDGVGFGGVEDGEGGDGSVGEGLAEPVGGGLGDDVGASRPPPGEFFGSGGEGGKGEIGVPGDGVGDSEGEWVWEWGAVEFEGD